MGANRPEYMRAYRAAHRDELAVKQRAYAAAHRDENRARSRAHYGEHREERMAAQRAYNAAHRDESRQYRRTPSVMEAHRRRAARDKAKHPLETRARLALGYAVQSGRVIRGPCIRCGAGRTHGHHYLGYDERHWLHVVWLCVTHHALAHRQVA